MSKGVLYTSAESNIHSEVFFLVCKHSLSGGPKWDQTLDLFISFFKTITNVCKNLKIENFIHTCILKDKHNKKLLTFNILLAIEINFSDF